LKIIQLKEVDSTNQYAKRLLAEKQPEEGTMIISGFQTSGLGQQGNSWESERDKNLLVSMVLYPKFPDLSALFYLNEAISLAVYDFINLFAKQTAISVKWPNDIYAGTRKIAGILIANEIEMNVVKHSIVGIGININQVNFPDYLPKPVSLKTLTNRDYPLKILAEKLQASVMSRYKMIQNGKFLQIKQDYMESLYLYNKTSDFKTSLGEVFTGKISGVSDDGKLLISDKDKVVAYDFKEIAFL
jgi:BirA family transcriptional regulator, biotin operon repressor / biotin---[acetyl-CoA-carboxylase] ligase